MELRYQVGDEIKSVHIERLGEHYFVAIGDRRYTVAAHRSASGELVMRVNGERHSAYVAASGSTRFVAVDGRVLELSLPESGRARRRRLHQGEGSLTASMPGQVRQVLVAEGDSVARGQTLIVLEAMKMEIRVAAPRAGRVARVQVSEGQVVDRGQVLIEMAEAA